MEKKKQKIFKLKMPDNYACFRQIFVKFRFEFFLNFFLNHFKSVSPCVFYNFEVEKKNNRFLPPECCDNFIMGKQPLKSLRLHLNPRNLSLK